MSSLFSSFSDNWRKFCLPISLFFLFLSYFIANTGWYEASKLVLHGQAAPGKTPVLKVRWDSGQGFNQYEQRLFSFETLPKTGQVQVRFGATGRRYPASLSKNVVCTAILVDGQRLPFQELATSLLAADGALHFGKHDTLSFTVQATSQISFRFRTDTSSGVAFVEVNGKRVVYDLYMANEAAKFKQLDFWLLQQDGAFTVENEMPRYPVKKLEIMSGRPAVSIRLTSVELHSNDKVLALFHDQTSKFGEYYIDTSLEKLHSFFQPLQFVQQLFFALLSTWLSITLIHVYRSNQGLHGCFIKKQHYWFWLILALSLTVFGCWLAAFWPGVLSVDSMKIWRAAVLPDVYLNDHPVLNVLVYKYLYHYWTNPAVVPLTQVLLTSLLIAWFAFWLYQQGSPLTGILLWLVFVLCSVPVAVYNVVLWKDIPFALLVVFWACLLVKLRQEKKEKQLRWTGQRICALLLLGLGLGFIRHNGLVYLAVLPTLLLLLRLVPCKKAVPVFLTFLCATGLTLVLLHQAGKTAFLDKELQKYSIHLSTKKMAEDSVRVAKDYLTVLDMRQTQQQWDKFHHYFQDRQAWWFLRLSGWWDVFPYKQAEPYFPVFHKTALQIYEKSYQKPWIWVTWNPVWLLVLLPVLTVLFRWLPNTAILGTILLSGALPLIYLRIFNWRYYYFLYFGLLFVPAFMMLDFTSRKKCVSQL